MTIYVNCMKKIVIDHAAASGKYTDYQLQLISHGFDIVLSDTKCFLSVICISILLFHDLTNTLLYLLILSTLRSYTGGYHSSTHSGCLLTFISAYLGFELLSHIPISDPILFFIFVICAIYTIRCSPVEHINNPLTEEERTVNQKKAIMCVFVLSVFLLSSMVKVHRTAKTIVVTILINTSLMHGLKYTRYWRKV